MENSEGGDVTVCSALLKPRPGWLMAHAGHYTCTKACGQETLIKICQLSIISHFMKEISFVAQTLMTSCLLPVLHQTEFLTVCSKFLCLTKAWCYPEPGPAATIKETGCFFFFMCSPEPRKWPKQEQQVERQTLKAKKWFTCDERTQICRTGNCVDVLIRGQC